MFLVSTRNFPPELGGMQNLMEGLSNALLNHGPVKVFADNHDDAKIYDQNSKLSICLLYTSPSPRDEKVSRMPSSA